jgi:type IV pilus assembly protein PilO
MAALKLKGGGGLESLGLVGKLIVGIVFVAMAGAVYFVVFYSEVESSIAQQIELVATKKAELEKAEEAKGAYNKDLAEKAQREQVQRKQKKILPDEAETPAFLSSVQTVATISGVKLASWTPLDEVPEDFYAKVPMELKLRGKYHQVAKFFNGIGQLDRIINMEDISVVIAKESAVAKAPAAPGVAVVEPDTGVNVEVECLATAFRSLKPGEAPKKKKPAPGAPAGGGAH